jgi:hypothetical protein
MVKRSFSINMFSCQRIILYQSHSYMDLIVIMTNMYITQLSIDIVLIDVFNLLNIKHDSDLE